ncbi:caspase-3-like [Leptodactylus fuscus]|uniref:caspase-3-like n=1 Tax=Leptodactylus fuscus TaxID=238119 RepID=UPI003F4EAAD7
MAEANTGSDEIYKYKMDYPQKGRCLIINMENFQEDQKLPRRTGTSQDENRLKDVFENLGFQVQIEKDKKCDEIVNILDKVAGDDHSNCNCFVCIVMSHGNEGEFYGFDDSFSDKILFEKFNGENCPSLVGKPKLFFLQKCNGQDRDRGVIQHSGAETHGTIIPIEADFLYHYASSPGYLAYRNIPGSWFIQSLCEMLEKYWDKKELLHILTLVNHKVAYEYPRIEKGKNARYKQMPCVVSRLTKLLYL